MIDTNLLGLADIARPGFALKIIKAIRKLS
jgi:hypothetical protein